MTPFSARIRAEVLASFPEWAVQSSEERWEDSQPYLVVTVQAPNAADTLPLRLSTCDEEITIDFDYYHTHFDHWNPEPGDSRHQSALLYVRDLLSEKVSVASWWQEDHCKLCAQLEPGASLTPSLNIEYTRVRVRSWNGLHNAERDA